MIEIVKGKDVAYRGKEYTPREQGKRMITYDIALSQILNYLEQQPNYNAFVQKMIDDENARLEAQKKYAKEQEIAAKNAMIDSEVKAKEALIAKLQQEAQALTMKKDTVKVTEDKPIEVTNYTKDEGKKKSK